jgi:hypothetical protein
MTMPVNANHDPYSNASIDALIAATAGAGVPDIGGYVICKFLQRNSPECDRHADEHVEGAEPGMYWLAATKTLYTNPVAHPLGLRAYW